MILRRLLTVPAFLILFGEPSLPQGNKPPAVADLVARLRAKREATDFRASGRLVRLTQYGERRVFQFSMAAKYFDGTVKVFYEVSAPPAAGFRLLLEGAANGAIRARIGHLGDAAPETPAAVTDDEIPGALKAMDGNPRLPVVGWRPMA